LDEVRNLKHELRTPVNHIVGYSALLLESAQDAGNDALTRQAREIQTIGGELHMVVEGILIHLQRALRVENIAAILGTLAPLNARVEENLSQSAVSTMDQSFLMDLQRIRGAIHRLESLLEGIASSPEGSVR
jgi:signal transduction histidine kinase